MRQLLLLLIFFNAALAFNDYQDDTVVGYLRNENYVDDDGDYYYYDDPEEQPEPLQEAPAHDHVLLEKDSQAAAAAPSLADNPVFNWILTFSFLALFFHAFYTPFGKVTIGRKRR